MVRLEPVEGHEQAGQRPVLVVSYEPFHNSGLMTVVPISLARVEPRLPGDVAVTAGEAGLAKPGVILCSQMRTVSVLRIVSQRTSGGQIQYLTSPALRGEVREALAHHLGLDLRPEADGAPGAN
jgi:mRNA interferase MazF